MRPTLANVDVDMVARVALHASHALSRSEALAIWRGLVTRFPSEPRLAARYVEELLLVEAWQELDAFQQTASAYETALLDLRYVDVAIARLQVDAAEAMLERLRAREGESAALLSRRYSLEMLRRQFQAAERTAHALLEFRHDEQRVAEMAMGARRYGDIERAWRGTASKERNYDVLLINLDTDTTRLQRMQTQLSDIEFTRIPGVRGAHLPNHALRLLTRDMGHLQKGTVGCFLSHIAAWEAVVKSGRTTLVLEDDAWLIAGLPPSLAELPLPRGFDLCFANERMSDPRHRYSEQTFRTRSAGAVAARKPPEWSSAGTDGYFVSPKGARKLLALVQRDGLAGDVDWRLVSYSLTPRQRQRSIARGGFAGAALDFHERVRSPDGGIRSSALHPPLVRQFAGGSVRLWDNELSHSHVAMVHELAADRKLNGVTGG